MTNQVAKEAEEKAEAPKLRLNLTSQEWENWKSSWARYKRITGLTDQLDSVYSLWGCFTCELEMVAFDDKLDQDADLEQYEERIIKRRGRGGGGGLE